MSVDILRADFFTFNNSWPINTNCAYQKYGHLFKIKFRMCLEKSN